MIVSCCGTSSIPRRTPWYGPLDANRTSPGMAVTSFSPNQRQMGDLSIYSASPDRSCRRVPDGQGRHGLWCHRGPLGRRHNIKWLTFGYGTKAYESVELLPVTQNVQAACSEAHMSQRNVVAVDSRIDRVTERDL